MAPGQIAGAAEGRDSREVSTGTCTRTVPFALLVPLSLTQRGWLRIVQKVPQPGYQPGRSLGG
jgi:hypothetical protein